MEVGHWDRGPSTLWAVLCCSVDSRDHHLQSAAVVSLVALPWGDSFGTTLSLACPLFSACCQGCAGFEHVPVVGPAPESTRAAVAQKEMPSPMLCVSSRMEHPRITYPTNGFGLRLLLPILDEQKHFTVSGQCWIKTELQTGLKCVRFIYSFQALTMFGRIATINPKSQ